MNSFGTLAMLFPTESTKNNITKICDILNIENVTAPDHLHVTIIYSRVECPDVKNTPIDFPITAKGTKFDIFKGSLIRNCLVLELYSPYMDYLHAYCREVYGATHDFPSFRPHVTLSQDYSQKHLPNDSILEYFQDLMFDRLVVEKLDFSRYQ